MSQPQPSHAVCSLIVVRVTQDQVVGDTIADALRDQLLALYTNSGAVHAVIDMQEVKYLSSAGIRPLLSLSKKVREREGRLILAGLTDEVEGVFVATRLISTSGSMPATFESHPDVPSSVASLYHMPQKGA
jgi:anti-anti-sigma factor